MIDAADALEPGAAALHLRRPQVEPARRHRPHRHRARRARAGARLASPLRDPRSHCRAARRRRFPACRARRCASDCAPHAARAHRIWRARMSRLALQRGGAARSRRRARWACRLRRSCARAAARRRRRHRPAAGAGRHRRAASTACDGDLHPQPRSARWSTTRRTCAATAASCAPATRADLDEARALRDDSRKVMAALEAKYLRARPASRSLKVRHNNILGYYIEVPAGAAKPMTEPAAQRHLPPPPDHGRRRALHHRRS